MATLTAIFNAQDNLSKAMANAGNAGSKTSGVMQKLGKIGSAAMKGIVTAVAAAGTALLGFGKKAVNVGMTYEKSMSQVMATMGKTTATDEGREAYEKLSAAAEKMGAETAFTSSQAADALNYLALAGYEVDDAVAALPTVLHLAGAGGMELATASDMITDSMAALQLEVNQVNLDRFADQMAKTASTTNTSVSQLGNAILGVGANAANLRNGTTELNTQLGILANVGIKGSEAGTKFRNVLQSLGKASDKTSKVGKQLKKLGVEVYDTDGKMRDTGAIFKDLKASMEGWNQSKIDQVMSTLFNKQDLAAAKALLAGSGDEYDRIFAIIENSGGAAAEMYQTMLDNLNGDVDIFKSATEALYLSLYKSANATLRNLVQTGTSYMTRLNDAFNQGGFSGLAAELGNVLGDAVGVIMSYAPDVISAAVEVVSSLVDSIGNNADAIAEGAVEIALKLGEAIIKIAPKLAAAFVKLIAAAGKALLNAIPRVFSAVPDAIYNALGIDKAAFISGIGQTIQNVISSISQFVEKFKSIGGIQAVIAGLVAAFAALKAINIGKSFMNMAKGIKKAGGVMKLLAANKIMLIVAAIAALAAGIVLLVKNWTKVKAALRGGIDKVFGAGTFDKVAASLGKVGEGFKKVGDWAKTSFDNMKSAFSEGYKTGGLVGGIKSALDSLKKSFSEINWAELGGKAWDAIKSGFTATGDWIKQKVLGDGYTPDSTWGDVGAKIWDTVKNGISDAGDWLKEKLGYSPSDSWGQIGLDLWGKIKNGISDASDWLKEKLGYTPGDSWSSIGLDLWEKIKSGINATGDWLKEKLGYTPSDSWGDVGADIWNKIWNGITDTGEILKEKLSGVLGKIPGFINELLGGGEAGAAGEGILTSIGEAFKTSFDNLTSYFEPVKASLEELWGKIAGIFEKLGPAIQTIGQVFLAIAKVIGTVIGAIVTWVVGAVNGIVNAVGPVVSFIVSGVGVILDVVSAVLSAIGGDFSGAWESLKSAFQGVIDMVQSLWAAISGFFSGIWSVVQGVVNAIVGAFSGVGAFISGIWTSIVNGLINALNWCIDRINDLTSGLSSIWTWTGLEGIGEIGHIEPVEVPVTYVPQNTAEGSGAEANPVEVPVTPTFDTSAYGQQITTATDAVTQQLSSATIEFPEPDLSGFDTANQAVEDTKSAIESMSSLELPDLSAGTSDLESLQSSITSATSGFADLETEISGIGTTLSGLNLSAAGAEAAQGYIEGMGGADAASGASALVASAENAVRAAQQSGSPAAAFMPIGAEAAQGYGMGLSQEDVSKYANAFATTATSSIGTAVQTEIAGLDYSPEGTALVTTLVTGMTAASPLAVASITTLGTQIRAIAQSIILTAQGLNMLRTLTAGMNSGRSAALSSARTTGTGIRSAFASVNLYSVGSNIIQGLRNGMRAMFSSLLATARQMAQQLKQTIQSGMEVHSPSRFTEWVGEMTGKGWVKGLEGATKKVTAAAAAMAMSVTGAFAPVAIAAPNIAAPVAQEYSAAAPQATVSPYDSFGGDSTDYSGSTNDRHIIIDVKGGGRIEVSGMTKEQAIELISEQLKPQLQEILAEEIYTGGESTYDY